MAAKARIEQIDRDGANGSTKGSAMTECMNVGDNWQDVTEALASCEQVLSAVGNLSAWEVGKPVYVTTLLRSSGTVAAQLATLVSLGFVTLSRDGQNSTVAITQAGVDSVLTCPEYKPDCVGLDATPERQDGVGMADFCSLCNGSGDGRHEGETCPLCVGSGAPRQVHDDPDYDPDEDWGRGELGGWS